MKLITKNISYEWKFHRKESDIMDKCNKYNIGDKFYLEIVGVVNGQCYPYTLYKLKDGRQVAEHFLDRLSKAEAADNAAENMWQLAIKLMLPEENGGIPKDILDAAFNGLSVVDIIQKYNAYEIKNKLIEFTSKIYESDLVKFLNDKNEEVFGEVLSIYHKKDNNSELCIINSYDTDDNDVIYLDYPVEKLEKVYNPFIK
jgi:hypothetical protein